MNQRIRELAEQANAHETGHAYYRGEKKPENAVTLHSVDLEKFAELIVRECIDILDDEDDGELTGRSIRIAAIRIKQHFGVE